jgi:hypothetical protein
MPCYHPLTGYRARYLTKNGKRPIVFNASQGFQDLPIEVPCGRCIGCRLDYSRQWAVRCTHEASLHEDNCFITLTYNSDNLPESNSIDKRELQLFFKKLRKAIYPTKVRYFACGEYGEQNRRPHYHSILFGWTPPDLQIHTIKNGNILWKSEYLEKIWSKGFCIIGQVTFESAAYVARYSTKKINGDEAEEHYKSVNEDTGEILQLQPEFSLMSRGSGKQDDSPKWRYGIGRAWFEEFKNDTNKDFITVRGNKSGLPKYYDKLLEKEDEEEFLKRKKKRRYRAKKNGEDNTLDRLRVKEKVKRAQITFLKRDFEGS